MAEKVVELWVLVMLMGFVKVLKQSWWYINWLGWLKGILSSLPLEWGGEVGDSPSPSSDFFFKIYIAGEEAERIWGELGGVPYPLKVYFSNVFKLGEFEGKGYLL